MYEQLIKPTFPWPYVGGWCEGFVSGSFGQSSKPQKDKFGNWFTTGPYPSAMAAWNANVGKGNHPNEQPPKGLYVPVYFKLANVSAGHSAIVRPDGSVLSSTQGGWHSAGAVHPNLQHLIDTYSNPAYGNGKCTYLGWKEYAGNAQVIRKKEDIVKPSDAQIQDMFGVNRVKGPNAQQMSYYRGQDIRVLQSDILGALRPSPAEVKQMFNEYLGRDPNKDQMGYYPGLNYRVLYQDLIGAVKKESTQSSKPTDQSAIDKAIKISEEAATAVKALKK